MAEPSPSLPPSEPEYDVFVSHAGAEKRGVVSHLVARMKEKGLKVFVDYEMTLGTHAPTAMEDAAQTAHVGLFVLSRNFLKREWPVKELRIFLDRADSGRNKSVRLVPYFFSVKAWDNNLSLLPEQKQLLDQVSEYTGLERIAGVSFEHEQVEKLATAVVALVVKIRALPSVTKTTSTVSIDVPEPVRWFAGREGDVNKIVKLIKGQLNDLEGRLLRVALVGAPGMGKSQLALKAVDKLLGKFAVHARLDASDETTLRNGFFALAQQLKVVWDDDNPKDSEDRVLRHVFTLNESWLLVLDNVKPNVEFAKELSKRIALRPKAASAVIATSQFESWPELAEPWESLKLEKLDGHDGLNLLKERLQEQKYKDSPSLPDIVSIFHGHPLALSAAGGYINELRKSPDVFLESIKKDPTFILSKHDNLSDNQKSVLAVVGLSIKLLSSGSQSVLRVISLVAPTNIPRDLVLTVLPREEEAFLQLSNVSLTVITDQFVSIHQLIQKTVQFLLPPDNDVTRRLLEALVSQTSLNVNGWLEVGRCSVFVPHIITFLGQEGALRPLKDCDSQKLFVQLHTNAGKIFYVLAEYDKALEHHKKSLGISLNLSGQIQDSEVYKLQANSHDNIGRAYFKKSDLEEALNCHEKALKIRAQTDPEIAWTYHHIGKVYARKGRHTRNITDAEQHFSDAERYYNLAQDEWRKDENFETNPDFASTLNNMGELYMLKGEYVGDRELAEKYYMKALNECYLEALKIREKLHNNQTAWTYENMGKIYRLLGENSRSDVKKLEYFKNSLEYYKDKAFPARKCSVGDKHRDTVWTCNSIGHIYYLMEQYDEALEWHAKALLTQEKILGMEHKTTKWTVERIGEIQKLKELKIKK